MKPVVGFVTFLASVAAALFEVEIHDDIAIEAVEVKSLPADCERFLLRSGSHDR